MNEKIYGIFKNDILMRDVATKCLLLFENKEDAKAVLDDIEDNGGAEVKKIDLT